MRVNKRPFRRQHARTSGPQSRRQPTSSLAVLLSLPVVTVLLALLAVTAAAQGSPIHPTFPLLDADGRHVLESNRPVSTMQTCGGCHDTDYIESHSFHASVGLGELAEAGSTGSGRQWDTSPGVFGRWNPMTYRYLTPAGDELLDLGTAGWIRLFGARHVGGGPAVRSQDGRPLTELTPTPGDPQTHVLDPETGEWLAWDWQESGVVEMNCFLCHLPNPDNEARVEALQAGDFAWANTATLLGSGLVETAPAGFRWNPAAFADDGDLLPEFVTIQDPDDDNCGQCHGLVHDDVDEPVVHAGCSPAEWTTETTGQVISPQRMSESGMNLAGKTQLTRSWDIHAERRLECVDCHYSLNNPIYFQEGTETQPEHLTFDARRLDIGEYLQRPSHEFARGLSAQSTVAPEVAASMRRCESCHDATATHAWLPYQERHFTAMSCETCHIPQLHAPARQAYDWTLLAPDGEPLVECRGVEGKGARWDAMPAGENVQMLITGYEPILLLRTDQAGNTALAPYNLVTSWFWVHGDPERPVRVDDLRRALQDDDAALANSEAFQYHQDVIAALDSDGDGDLTGVELRLDTEVKVAAVATRLAAVGLDNPRIRGEIQPYSINHNVAHGDWVTRDCETCHSEESRVTQPLLLSSFVPGGVMPSFVQDANVSTGGQLVVHDAGELTYQPASLDEGLYIIGHDRYDWIGWGGLVIFLGTLVGIVAHGGLRAYTSTRQVKPEQPTRQVYMYAVYERAWHWLQALAIILLIGTGLIIHRPDLFGVLDFGLAVPIHNILGFLLLANAALAVFYHLASGEIRQYLPQPRGFFSQAITQASYYLRGLFKGEDHPFEKRVDKKLNPLQQITYFAILNVLLPLQVITGVMIWGAQRWPELAARLGGLPLLSPIHTLAAWLFAAFLVIHIYLTTTGPTPLSNMKAMVVGWDEVEVHEGEGVNG